MIYNSKDYLVSYTRIKEFKSKRLFECIKNRLLYNLHIQKEFHIENYYSFRIKNIFLINEKECRNYSHMFFYFTLNLFL